MKSALQLLCIVLGLLASAGAQQSAPLLDRDDVWLLVMNVPEVLDLESRKGCPSLELTPVGEDRMWVHVRNKCPRSGNGSMGLFTVDLRDGRIWYGVDPFQFVDSERLRRLRKVLLSREDLRARCSVQK